MSIFAIGDLHLSFGENVEKPMDIFGPEWVGHAEKLQKNWNETITNEDTIVIAGDISWGLRLGQAMADLEWIHNLPGTKVLIKGNHDLWWTSINTLTKLYEDIIFIQNHAYISEKENYAICGTRGWICPGTVGYDEHDNKIYEREQIRLKFSLEEAKNSGIQNIMVALHYPPTNDKMQTSGFTRLLSEYGVKTCVYGHLHGNDAYKNGIKGNLNGVEYKLVSLDYLSCMPQKIVTSKMNWEEKK